MKLQDCHSSIIDYIHENPISTGIPRLHGQPFAKVKNRKHRICEEDLELEEILVIIS